MVTHFKKNKSVSRQIIFKLGAFFVILVVVILIIADIRLYDRKKLVDAQTQALQGKIQSMQDQNDALKEKISNTDNSQYIDKVAREDFDLQKPGEKVVSFIVPQSQPQEVNSAPKSGFQIWLGWVSGSWNWVKGLFH